MGDEIELPEGSDYAKISRGALQIAGGAIPFAGGVLSAIAGAWSEKEQKKVNRFFEHWIRMIRDEIIEKEKTVVEIMARLDLAPVKRTPRLGDSHCVFEGQGAFVAQ